MDSLARHYQTGSWVRVSTQDTTIAAVAPADGPEECNAADDGIAPAFWDLQLNGRWGVSFSDPDLTVEQVATIVRAQAELGTARLCPTLITAPIDHLRHGLVTIARACDAIPDVASRVVGIHLEGPYISSIDGYRGAHPLAAVHDPDWDEFQSLQDASGGRIVLITLAPERPGAIAFIERAVASGVVVALGHTAADAMTLQSAVAAGASLSTHLGNGIAAHLPRHPNPIWHQAADDRLWASLIADGHHLDPDTLRVLVRAKTPGRVILVSDASPLAGLPPGRYGAWAVDPSGKIVVADTPYLAGSNQALDVGLGHLIRHVGLTPAAALATVTSHPARLLGRPEPTLEPGRPADLVRFRLGADGEFQLLATCVDGRWIEAHPGPTSPSA
ncbi:MAG TPA: amidohydrolase family protein [Isosphaeraceae bacterium]